MFIAARYCLLLLLLGPPAILPAQAQQDSVLLSLNLLQELVKAGNFEEAQLEAAQLRTTLQAQHITIPAAAVPLLSKIYAHNRDEKSALEFLSEASSASRLDTNPETRVLLLQALVKAYAEREAYPLALSCQEALIAAKDAFANSRQEKAILAMQAKLDSLGNLKLQEKAAQANYVQLHNDWLYPLAGCLGLFFMILVWWNWKTSQRWRKRLYQKIQENDFLRSERFTSTLPAEPLPLELAAPPETNPEQGIPLRSDYNRPEKMALLIEPNRQIVLYLKSLLSDRFDVETASTPSEGLQVATNHLPDLIICDAVLNGQTGIDVVRQIKLSERTNHIPVILLSEHFGNEGKLDALRAGADAWFNRPVLDNEFDAQVTKLLDARKEHHENFARFLHLYFSENRIAISDPFLSRMVQIIEQNLADPDFMADDLARKMQLHKQHFFKKLQVLTGKEPVQLIREMRLEKAKSLLEIRAGTPQVISELVGFSSPGSFALAFKEYFGENTSLLQNRS